MAYIAAELHPFEGDFAEGGVGTVEGFGKGGGLGGDGEDAASGSDDVSVD